MKAHLQWSQGMKFEVEANGNTVAMDSKAPLGHGSAMTPKELVVAGMGGCTAMDVIALLKKHKQPVQSFAIDLEVDSSQGSHPTVFTEARLIFQATGPIDPNILIESVQLSQSKYCGVSAMLSKAFPIRYIVHLNGEKIYAGQAHFE
jgi:putative redox protein